MTDANANVVAKTDYTAYGAAADNSSKTEAPGYTGQYEDPLTGLTYMQARYYDADLGRFISTDPVAARAGDVFNFNRYAYANDNPLNFTDPTGMDTCAAFVNGVYDSTGECDAAVSPPSGGGGGGGGGGSGGGSGPSEGGMPGFEFDRTPTEKPVNVTANAPPTVSPPKCLAAYPAIASPLSSNVLLISAEVQPFETAVTSRKRHSGQGLHRAVATSNRGTRILRSKRRLNRHAASAR